MRLAFRQRLFLGLAVLGTVPLAAALIVLALQVWSSGALAGPRAALDEVAVSGRAIIEAIDTTRLDEGERAALRDHTQTIARGTMMARRAETLRRYAAGALALVTLLAALVLIGVSLQLARRWSRYFSAPIEELTSWVQRIEQRQPLPDQANTRSAPEFASLQSALREMSRAVETARRQELEKERLVAFREVARRVAHEIRGPLTSARLALDQLEKNPDGSSDRDSAIEVLREENRRLEHMAREFSEFGRLPEGPEADIDLGQLLDSVIPATVPDEVHINRSVDADLLVHGHYEPLRRAVQNLLRNAVEASEGEAIDINARWRDGHVQLEIADHGLGITPDAREQIFEPYFTTKGAGTGLGLAIVKQIVEVHGGTVTVSDTPGGGATFAIELPASP